jgi:hypothetical protein
MNSNHQERKKKEKSFTQKVISAIKEPFTTEGFESGFLGGIFHKVISFMLTCAVIYILIFLYRHKDDFKSDMRYGATTATQLLTPQTNTGQPVVYVQPGQQMMPQPMYAQTGPQVMQQPGLQQVQPVQPVTTGGGYFGLNDITITPN